MKPEDNPHAMIKKTATENAVQALVAVVRKQREEDHQLAMTNYKLGSLNLFIGFANYAKNKHLEKKQVALRARLKEGEAVVAQMESELEKQSGLLDTAENAIQHNKKKVTSLEEHIEEIVKKYDSELASQRKILEHQRRELLRMTLSMFKQDLTVDSSIVLISWLIINTPMVDWPLRLITATTSSLPLPLQRNAKHLVVSRLARCAMLLAIVRAFRVGAIRKGWHNKVGGPKAYLARSVDVLKGMAVTKNANKENGEDLNSNELSV